MSDEKIIEILKSKGSIEAVKQVKTVYDISFTEAQEVVDDLLAKNPGIVLPREQVSIAKTPLPVGNFKIY